jgi:competence protein ComEC
MLAVPAPAAARWGGLLLATAYALLAGWGVPAQRTVLMIAGVVLLRSAGLRWPQPLVLLAAACVTVVDPWALLQPGFWLSFVAVGLLIASDPVRAPGRRPRAGWPRAPARRWCRAAHPGRGHRRPGAADAGVLPAAVAGGLRGQPGGHSAGDLGHHAAGAGRHAAAGLVGAGSGW